MHDSFMKKVEERNMIDAFQKKCAESEEELEATKTDLAQKRAAFANNQKLQEYRDKVENIRIDYSKIHKERAKIQGDILTLCSSGKKEIPVEEAKYEISEFKTKVQKVLRNAANNISFILENDVKKVCRDVEQEYRAYIDSLRNDGFLSIGSFNMEKTDLLSSVDLDISATSTYKIQKDVKTGTRTVKKRGVLAFFARVFAVGGWEEVPVYESKTFVQLDRLLSDKMTSIIKAMTKAIEKIIENANQQIENIKTATARRLSHLDQAIKNQMDEIEKILSNYENLKITVEQNKEKA